MDVRCNEAGGNDAVQENFATNLEAMPPLDLPMCLQQKLSSIDSALRRKWTFAITRLEEKLPFGKM